MKDYKKIVSYNNNFCVLIPVYYENETRPAWRKYYIGTQDEAKEAFKAAPDYLNATADENRQNRQRKRQEYILLLNHGKHKEAAAIKATYHF